MKLLLAFDLPAPLQKNYFQRIILAAALLLMAILLFATTHEPESWIGLLGTFYFFISSFSLVRSWNDGKIICVSGQCISVENTIGNMLQAVFSVEDIEERTLTLSVPKKGVKLVSSLEYNLYLSRDNHNILYGLEIRSLPAEH